jgi:DNA polymerase-1
MNTHTQGGIHLSNPAAAGRLLIDAEGLLYSAACAGEQEVEWQEDLWTYWCDHKVAQDVFQEAAAGLCRLAPEHFPVIICGGSRNFRYGLWADYKSNRRGKRKPAGYSGLLDWLETNAASRGWGFSRLVSVEGDDVLGLLADPSQDIIASDDKDMLTVPGRVLRRGEIHQISEMDADISFLSQALIGDSADGYPGCPKVGEKGAEKLLQGVTSLREGWEIVVKAFQKAGRNEQFALTMARCARILRPGEFDWDSGTPILWQPPT